jgi:hypothetical protein
LTKAGYDVKTPEATVDELRNVSGDGIFYIHTHGGMLDFQDGSSSYALLTATERDEAREQTDALLRGEIATGRIGFGVVPMDKKLSDLLGKAHINRNVTFYYAVGPGFAAAHWKLKAPAMAFINACESAKVEAGAGVLANALHDNGASLYVGWTEEVDNRVGQDAARYLFDRLLGANQFKPETPKQRPFAWPAVETDMKTKGLSSSSATGPDGNQHNAVLKFVDYDGKLGPLAPSIGVVDPVVAGGGGAGPTRLAAASSTLTLHGLFGTQDGTVYVGADVDGQGGTALSGCAMAGDSATCTIAPDQAGYLVAEVNGVRGNPVHLTSWHVNLRFANHVKYGSGSDAVESMTANMHVRADIQKHRDEPGADPVAPTSSALAAESDSTCAYAASGTYPDDQSSVTLSGSGSAPISPQMIDLSSDTGCFMPGVMDFANGSYLMGLYFAAQGAVTATVVDSKGTHVLPPQPMVAATMPGLANATAPAGWPAVSVSLQGTTLQGGSRTFDVTDSTGTAHMTLDWDDAAPDEPPSDDTPQ